MSELVDLVHKAEDKFRPVGEYPSVNFIPENSDEFKKIRAKVQQDDVVKSTKNIREGIKLGLSKREMSRKYQISFTQIRKIIEANGWESQVVKEKRKVYSMLDSDGNLIDRGTAVNLAQRHDLSPSKIYASAHANSGKTGIVHKGNYFVNSDIKEVNNGKTTKTL